MNWLFENRSCGLAVLIDPDKFNPELIHLADANSVRCFFVGGSGQLTHSTKKTVKKIKRLSQKHVVLFPGDETQLCREADGLLLLSLLSGRNTEFLIEKHVKAAPIIKKLKLEHIPVAYLLVGKGKISTTQKITGTQPLTNTRTILNTALAAEQLGFKAIYLEAGSGAGHTISASLIKKIKKSVPLPLIVGGGIDTKTKALKTKNAGADLVVIGNILEKNPERLLEISSIFNPE
jgi:phosphoglycerol geranylgeranyltransferase